MQIKNKDLKRRIIEISYKHHLSHLGSCLTAVDIIDEIFSLKKPDEKFVLSSGHAGLALYVVLEKYKGIDAEKNFLASGVHPDRLEGIGIDCSTGSLGCGLPIAVGMALADRSKNCYVLISDGECAEGSVWEAMRIKEEQELNNLKIHCNWNGWAAYKETNLASPLYRNLPLRINCHYTNMKQWPEWLSGQSAHYCTLDEKRYNELLCLF